MLPCNCNVQVCILSSKTNPNNGPSYRLSIDIIFDRRFMNITRNIEMHPQLLTFPASSSSASTYVSNPVRYESDLSKLFRMGLLDQLPSLLTDSDPLIYPGRYQNSYVIESTIKMDVIHDEDRKRRLRLLEERIQNPQSKGNIDSLLDTVQALYTDCDHPSIKKQKNVEVYLQRCK